MAESTTVVYFNSQIRAEINFSLVENTFQEYSLILYGLHQLDRVYYCFKERKPYRHFFLKTQKTKVSGVSSGTFHLDVFTENHWFDLLVLFVSINRRQVEKNIRDNLNDLNTLYKIFVASVEEVTNDFPRLEIEIIEELIQYLKSLTEEQLKRFIQMMLIIGERLKNLISITRR